MKGDVFSSSVRGVAGIRVVISVTDSDVGLLAIFGFSARFTVGGGGLKLADGSRRISTDLRGGGGDGARIGYVLGDFEASMSGV